MEDVTPARGRHGRPAGHADRSTTSSQMAPRLQRQIRVSTLVGLGIRCRCSTDPGDLAPAGDREGYADR
jgi:hypothetical protein